MSDDEFFEKEKDNNRYLKKIKQNETNRFSSYAFEDTNN